MKFNNFDLLVGSILESNSVAQVLGTPTEVIYDPDDLTNDDSYQKGHHISPKILGKKIIRRNMPTDSIFMGRKKKTKRNKK